MDFWAHFLTSLATFIGVVAALLQSRTNHAKIEEIKKTVKGE